MTRKGTPAAAWFYGQPGFHSTVPKDRVVFRLRDGKMRPVEEPQRPDRPNFVIVCEYGDWSGFRTLAECESQFSQLETSGRPNGYYEVVER